MRQLSAHDATFLYSDTTHSNANVTLIHIYNQSTSPGGRVRFKSVLAHIENRLDRLPKLRQKLQRVPLDLDYPYWIDDENFDLEYHVRHIALPKPGDWRQFCIQASRIHARPLDLNRPLWEIYVIEGLDSFLDLPEGSFALLTKTHHAAIDVENGSEITTLLHDLSPARAAAAPPAPWFPRRPPGTVAMAARGAVHSLAAAARLAGPLGQAIRGAVPSALKLAGHWLSAKGTMPVTRFNAVVSPHRVFETRRFELEDFKTIRTLVDSATVNDAVLAVCGGALRRYLEGHAELPETSLTAMTPLFVHAAGGAGEPHEMTSLCVELGTDIADPLQRLQKLQAQTSSSAVIARAVRPRELQQIGSHVPAATLALSGKLLGRATAGIGRRAPLANCTITNVPGPSQPLYLCGARMTYFSAIMPIADGMGLVFAVTSYDGRITISPTSCRELVPDPAHLAQCVRDSFQEYLALAQARASHPRAQARPKRAAEGAKTGKSAPAGRTKRAGVARPAASAAPRPARRRVSTSGKGSPTIRTA